MTNWFDQAIRAWIAHWGYLAVAANLLCENMGLPVPGETALMFSSFLANKGTSLQLYYIIPIGIAACTLGDNVGFLIGRKYGRTLIRWVKKVFRQTDEDIAAAKDLIRRHGNTSVFWARFVFGFRTVAGPFAGMLGMEWRDFLLYNFLGAVLWVTTIALLAYFISNEFGSLVGYVEKASWSISIGLFTLGYLAWRHYKKNYRRRIRAHKAA
ncbi:MAG TPA: DedA family protein [Candidatus Acidoferrales bacterium]|nr:DedA family protein [Candidatus Acidoferrales bacterium]